MPKTPPHPPIPPELANKHVGEVCIILGTGPSLADYDLTDPFFTKNVTFGSNAIGKVFNPTYYVVTDPHAVRVWNKYIRQSDEAGKSTFLMSSYIWKNQAMVKSKKHMIYYRGRDRVGAPGAGRIYNGRTTGIVMIHLAYLMGFKYVFVLGLDGYHCGTRSSHFYDDRKEGNGRSDKRSDWVVKTCLALAAARFKACGRGLFNLSSKTLFRDAMPSWWGHQKFRP